MNKLSLLVISGLSVMSLPTQAENNFDNYGFVGGSITSGSSVFSDESAVSYGAEPNFFYNGDYGFIDGSLINYSVLPWLGITGQWRFETVSDDINSLPKGIENRDGSGEIGVTFGTVGARLTYLHDISNVHDGYEVQLHLGRSFQTGLSHFSLTPYMEIDYRDKNLSRHLYNVSANEAKESSLAAFDSNSSWVYQAGLIGIYDFSPNWLGLIKAEFEHHDSDSPLIQRDVGWSLSLGIAYNFSSHL